MLVCTLLNKMLTNSVLLHVFKNDSQFSFMIVLTANWMNTKDESKQSSNLAFLKTVNLFQPYYPYG